MDDRELYQHLMEIKQTQQTILEILAQTNETITEEEEETETEIIPTPTTTTNKTKINLKPVKEWKTQTA